MKLSYNPVKEELPVVEYEGKPYTFQTRNEIYLGDWSIATHLNNPIRDKVNFPIIVPTFHNIFDRFAKHNLKKSKEGYPPEWRT